MRRATRISAAVLGVLAAVSSFADDDIPHDLLQGIEAMQRLPADGFQLVQSKGRLLLVSTNGHYAVSGGRILDLWNRMELHSVADVQSSMRLPLARMGINVKHVGGLSTGKDEQVAAVTVFLDPLSAESRKLLPQLREVAAKHRIDVVFLPAQPARAGVSRALICDKRAALAFLEQGITPSTLSAKERCGAQELQHAQVLAKILGIHAVPFSVAANGVAISGTPNDFSDFVASNQSSAAAEGN